MYIGEIKVSNTHKAITSIIKKRVLVLDGAMGTQIQKYKLKNKHYINTLSVSRLQTGNNDILNVTQPRLIEKIHTDYIKVSADIIETNTFSSNKVSQSDYNMQSECYRLNKHGVLIARRASLKQSFLSNKRVFVAGSVGPTNKTASMSPNVLKPSYRAITFDELVSAYETQISCMMLNKIDAIMVETIFDTLNAKAAIYAYYKVCLKQKTKPPIVLSATISDNSGRTLSGQTIEAFWTSIKHANPLCVGLNCALGADKLKPHIALLSSIANVPICAYPNAGLPNEFGEYNETPQQFANKIKEYVKDGLVNIVGGCCGSSPAHIAALKRITTHARPRAVARSHTHALTLSGIEALKINRNEFYKIGERANITGSAKFKQLIIRGKREEALEIIREQIANGANIIDINTDEALLNSSEEMKELINLIGSEPDISRTPLMIDSSNWDTLLMGIKCTQGKSIANSVSLKDGEVEFLSKAQTIRMCGCALIVIAFDELGQANTIKNRLQICNRAQALLKRVGYELHDIIFDLNTFAVATGLSEHNNSALELIKSIKLVTALFPTANISAGVSNLSFSFRGNSLIRESLHSVFLAHAIKAGLNLGIINVNKQIDISSLNYNAVKLCEQLMFNIREFSIAEITETLSGKSRAYVTKADSTWRKWDLKSKLSHAIITGIDKFIEDDSITLSSSVPPISIIEGPLMDGMNIVGKLFGSGKMFLPQVVKSARVMKKAVQALTPLLIKTQAHVTHTIMLATVKGDVHDIGKNIVGIVLSCNNYKIIDLGIMVPASEIIKAAISAKVDIIGLSGLITPSLDEMVNVANRLQASGVNIPLLIGGATTSKIHTAVKIFPEYPNGITIHVTNASKAVNVVSKLLSQNKQAFINKIKTEYQLIASTYSKSKLKENKIEYKQLLKLKPILAQKRIKTPNVLGGKLNLITNFKNITESINWETYVQAQNSSQTEQNKSDITKKKLINRILSLIKLITTERWFNIKCNTIIKRAKSARQQIVILDSKNNLIERLPMLSQQHTDSEYLSLSDFVNTDADHIGAFCCSASYESVLVQRFLKHIGKQQLANALKTLCDRLVEECSTYMFNSIKQHTWGFLDKSSCVSDDTNRAGIRPAPGYPVCPDHHIKLKLTKLLQSKEKIGLIINNKHLMCPQSSIITLILANKTSFYFNIKNVNADQVSTYASSTKLSVQKVEKALSAIIGYIPSYIEQ
ncbi:methionine synthase [Candidatus Hodgkinia cicadicola]